VNHSLLIESQLSIYLVLVKTYRLHIHNRFEFTVVYVTTSIFFCHQAAVIRVIHSKLVDSHILAHQALFEDYYCNILYPKGCNIWIRKTNMYTLGTKTSLPNKAFRNNGILFMHLRFINAWGPMIYHILYYYRRNKTTFFLP
jgi:hypothetical protein